jgi:transposase InsO family protein
MQLVIEALDMAIWNRRADPGVIHHSDHGSQYPRWPTASACARPGWSAPRARSAMPTTTWSPRPSSRRSSAS